MRDPATDGRWLALIAAVAVAVMTPLARAQNDCHCNCYFSVDCSTGEFCFWGEQGFTEQDSCWWRTPKPTNVPGAGCDQDFGSFGECDGRCTSSAAAGRSLVGGESKADVAQGVSVWASALTEASLGGGGVPASGWAQAADAIGFNNPTVSYGLWRIVTEVLMLARGPDYLVFPEKVGFTLWEVGVADLAGDPVGRTNGDVAVLMLLAELERPGAGRRFTERIDPDGLDAPMFERLCPDLDPLECLYRKVYDMGEALGQAGAEHPFALPTGDLQPPCPGCAADVVPDDDVNFNDVLEILSNWGEDRPDVNGDGLVGFLDLLEVLSRWGPCAP